MGIILGLAGLIYTIYCVWWVWNEEESLLWFAVVLFFGMIALIPYAIINQSRTAWYLVAGWAGFWVVDVIVALFTAPHH